MIKWGLSYPLTYIIADFWHYVQGLFCYLVAIFCHDSIAILTRAYLLCGESAKNLKKEPFFAKKQKRSGADFSPTKKPSIYNYGIFNFGKL
jgi:hypothetical protein